MLLILLGVNLIRAALPLELLSPVELNDDSSFLSLVFKIQEIIFARAIPKLRTHHRLELLTRKGRSVLMGIGFFKHACKARLRKGELGEGTSTELETMEKGLAGEGFLAMDSLF